MRLLYREMLIGRDIPCGFMLSCRQVLLCALHGDSDLQQGVSLEGDVDQQDVPLQEAAELGGAQMPAAE